MKINTGLDGIVMENQNMLQEMIREMGLHDSTSVSSCMIRKYAPGDIIIREGDASLEFFIILKGQVNIVKNISTKNEIKIAELCEMELLGEMTYFDNKRRSATGVANTETELLVLDVKTFESIQNLYPEFVNIIIKSIAGRIHNVYQKNQ